MAITRLNTYADVQNFIDQILTQNGEQGDVPNSPHRAFWRNMTYEQFVDGNVPGVTDPNTGQPMPILVKGNSAKSNLFLSLKGEGPLFDSNGPIGQMPANGPPFFTADQIASIAAWIDNGCLK
jgi:hypothetical protein